MAQPIPDTGPGLSGFLAHALWQVYAFFPGAGSWDWLLLFALVAVGANAAFLPYLWRSVSRDITYLRDGSVNDTGGLMGMPLGLWDFGWLWFCIWFFNTDAGRTLLENRGILEEGSSWLYWSTLGGVVGVLAASIGLSQVVVDTNRDAAGGTRPFEKRTFLTLYAGGGVFLRKSADNQAVVDAPVPVAAFVSLLTLGMLAFYWYWSSATLVLMLCFLAAAVCVDGIRILFVYILHKRTFG